MRNIKRLPEAIHSSVRSGVVIADLTRIVEELVFNSLDAGATKVSIAVGVGSSYVKVVDNGSGITRDGLVLLGERHESFDFHGEALCSISDVSLLEIVTKARGKPNGYRKIMKSSKCLFLGISDDRQDTGTTVTVRDIFYNQPVRRKHMESSPKKALDSIKMSVLRIALVHVNVCFKVMDVESADELLHTVPSSSPLPILSSNFGIEDSVSFYKVNLSDGELKLSGYISDPREIFSLKAIQYAYINSRFICKGPIHKLVNNLAAKFDLSSCWQPTNIYQNKKRNKYDLSPTFILNLHCPRSYYDIVASERSRTSVEFKDWGPVLAFIEIGIMRLWAENIYHEIPSQFSNKVLSGTYLQSTNTDMPNTSDSGERRSRKQNSGPSLDLCCRQRKKLCKNYDNMPVLEECVSSLGKPFRTVFEPKKHQIEAGLQSETDYLSRQFDRSLAGYEASAKKQIGSYLSPCNVLSPLHVAYAYGRKEDGISSSASRTILPAFDDNILVASGVDADCLKFNDDIYTVKDAVKSFMRNCSFDRSFLDEKKSPARGERFEFECDDLRTENKWVDCDDGRVDRIDLPICGRDIHCNGASPFQPSPASKYDMHEISKFPVRDSAETSLVIRDLLPDSSRRVWKCSSRQSLWSGPLTGEEKFGIKFHDDDDDTLCRTSVKGFSEFCKHGYSGERDALKFSNLNAKDSWQQQNCSFMVFSPDEKREFGEFHLGEFDKMFSPKPVKRVSETDWSPLGSYEESLENYSVPSLYGALQWEHEYGQPDSKNQETMFSRKKSSTRSHSAPPVYKGKKRYLDLTDSPTILSARSNFQNTCASMEPSNSKHAQLHAEARNLKSQKLSGKLHQSPMERSAIDCFFAKRLDLEMTPEVVPVQQCRSLKAEEFMDMGVEGLDLKEIQDFDSRWKWQKCCLTAAGGTVPDFSKSQDTVLDISSDILHLAGDPLVPKSIDRTSLEDAKVLSQVDKKFIAVVAGKTLAIIDQHAADERIRLEELRHKVLSGEMKTVTYLDAEQELVLPEIGHQLLHNYAEEIQTWGWICNIHSHDGSSFVKHLDFLNRQPAIVKLLAVPCILGVNLTDIDLLEFLQQLADTDGSSTIPPSVHRVLNNKACRGAIMFGDTLLPSECSLIVEELKRTSLCFQCAHGRPTTVPLVSLDLLHNKIAKLGSHESWHGLCQHELSLNRSVQRLRSALC
ncbi:DNA mismatch repair protein MLH3 isoform X2 [Sesamum indicum]|uniref:DNA mismatch repair protein MLH3 isoform X2 n=1 Tax=Sesamum indicum TaxID=4182 RepID=A0A8M8VDD6_SESIN|nr:DNA mismatch repair protein MLH3 isoform X2 [Sesamum indicum]